MQYTPAKEQLMASDKGGRRMEGIALERSIDGGGIADKGHV